MPNDESRQAASEIRSAAAEPSRLPSAWQPITRRGVATFSQARIGRLLIVQSIVAGLSAAAVLWFADTTWFPTALQAARRLPDTGVIENQRLSSPHTSVTPLAQTSFLAFVVDVEDRGSASLRADLHFEFHRADLEICSLFGCLVLEYPKNWIVQFNRPELESWWGAWKPFIYVMTFVGTMALLFASWLLLATLYCPVAWLFAYFKDRQLTLPGSWKLSAAALLPAALFLAGAILLYGLAIVDLIRLLLLWILHVLLGWIYVVGAVLALPRVEAARPSLNPFGTKKLRSSNPFTSPSSETKSHGDAEKP